MKILFVIYRLDFADHIAIPHLSAVAKALGHETHLVILQQQPDLAAEVARLKPDVVAYSANIHGFREMIEAHRAARAAHDFVSIMGGPHPTFNPGTFAEAGVDAYCIGEGEGPFHDFLVKVQAGESFDGVPNLITRNGATPVRRLIDDLGELPFPDRDITLRDTFLRDTPKKTFYATRGCPFNCSYCCNNYYQELYRHKGPVVRRFPVERLIREIEHVKANYRMDFLKFGDDLFAMRADDWLKEFAEKYSQRVGVPFNCFLRFDKINPEILTLLKKAGCHSVHLSVDSTSELVREKILGRRMGKVDIVRNIAMVRDYGIQTLVNYMLAAPLSTTEDDLATIALSKNARVSYTAYSTTTPMPGTALYDYCVKENIIDWNTYTDDMSGLQKPSALTCFDEKDKAVRYNILMLGSLISRFPSPLDRLATALLRVVPPLPVFKTIRDKYHFHSLEHRIFLLDKPLGRRLADKASGLASGLVGRVKGLLAGHGS